VIESRVLVWLLLEDEGAVLLALRKADRPPFAEQWTLPGDVMAIDESAMETIVRCGREHLDVGVRSEDFLATLELADGAVEYAVNVFSVGVLGQPRFRESGPYAEVRWLLPADIADQDSIPMPPALRQILTSTADRSPT
jgi:ADP-ribose pyrophosphatase YjhB (NUDIX family)